MKEGCGCPGNYLLNERITLFKLVADSDNLFKALRREDIAEFKKLIRMGADPFITDLKDKSVDSLKKEYADTSLLGVAMSFESKEFAAVVIGGIAYKILRGFNNYTDKLRALKSAYETSTNMFLGNLEDLIKESTMFDKDKLEWRKTELIDALYGHIDHKEIIMSIIDFRAQRAALFNKGTVRCNDQDGVGR